MKLNIENRKRKKRKDRMMKNERTNQEAKAAYDRAKSDIANLLGWFECELSKKSVFESGQAKTPVEVNWAHVGTMKNVRASLIETLCVLSGFDAATIRESLEDAQMADGNA